jgi:amino-acid N-acetyltransferase
MVFKIDYPVTLDLFFPSLIKDLALLSQTGFRVIIIPGAKEWIDAVLAKYSIVSRYKGTLRITSAEAMPFVEMAAFHSATRFMTGFSGSRVDAVIGNFVRARGLGVVDGVDMEHTGTVDRFYVESLSRVLELGMIPILPCIGWSSAGKPYNVPSEEIAFEAAAKLKAIKLFIISLSEVMKRDYYQIPESIETGENGRIIRLTPQEAARVLEINSHRIEKPDKPLEELSLALRACSVGVERVHIINGAEEGAVLKELFSNIGAGTMVYADEYESIRALHSKDIPDILRLMEPLMQEGFLIWRSPEDIESKKDDYVVLEIDSQIRACGALHDWGENQGEIAALAIDPHYAELGFGRRMIRYFLGRAEKKGFSRVFALTTRTHDWFESLGFRESPVEMLPQKKRVLYDKTRNSKVFTLDLNRNR